MKLLAIDTSNIIASVAIFEDGDLLGEKETEDQKTHSEKLLPAVDELLKGLNLSIKDIDLFAVSVGPGSFTGIRIGVATVKGMAQALNKKVIAVTSLQGLLNISEVNVCAIINARHGSCYYQIKHNNTLSEPNFGSIEQILNEVESFNEKFVFIGDAIEEFNNLIISKNNFEVFEKKIETSSDIGKIAWNMYLTEESNAVIPNKIVPIYLRKAQPDRGV